MRNRPRAINQEARPRQSGPSLALGTLTRADFFRGELEQFLLMSRENGVSPLEIKGSYAGAIGSVARYLNMHGWQAKARSPFQPASRATRCQ
jgi:membrane-bound lytic murein transglycosylase B